MKRCVIYLLTLLALLIPVGMTTELAGAVNPFPVCSQGAAATQVCQQVKGQNTTTNPVLVALKATLNILSLVVGVAAVVVLIVNAIRMVLSDGDAEAVKRARNGLIYSLVGLGVVALAQTIVAFTLQKVG